MVRLHSPLKVSKKLSSSRLLFSKLCSFTKNLCLLNLSRINPNYSLTWHIEQILSPKTTVLKCVDLELFWSQNFICILFTFVYQSEFKLEMCFSSKQKKVYHQMFNRMTDDPIKFDQSEIEELKKKFDKVAGYSENIEKSAFTKNMGILGLKSAFEFSHRLFNSFDIDNDGKISFQDFLEYMEVLKAGSDRHKARLSFKLIDYTNKNRFDMKDFKLYLNDFFKSWSSITNVAITPEIKERTDLYVGMIFSKVKKDKGTDVIDFKYYSETLYKDKQFLEAFEFITQGVASIFISDRSKNKQNDHSWILYKVLKELESINETIYDMTTDASRQFDDILIEDNSRSIPFAPGYLVNAKAEKFKESRERHNGHLGTPSNGNSQKKEGFNFFRCGENIAIEDEFQSKDVMAPSPKYSKVSRMFSRNDNLKEEDIENNTFHSVNTNRSNFPSQRPGAVSSESQNLVNAKKLAYLETALKKILNDNKMTLHQLEEKYQRGDDEIIKRKEKETIKNVHKKEQMKEGEMVFFGDDNWNMVLNMMIGIQMAVRSVGGYQEMILQEPKDFELKYYFELIPRRFGGEEYQSTIFSFTDYAPNTFNHIRTLFQIDNDEYIMSIGPNRLMASLMLGEVNSMTSLTSQGKSGSFFYYTADGKYMLKTIRYRQYRIMRSILRDYYHYVKKNPKTLITRFFGLHKLIEKDSKGSIIGKSYFVIMSNVFNTTETISERYDVKGSWYGRETTDTDPNATKKDLDFLKRKPLTVDSGQREQLISIMKKDADFFRKHEIIDYSLLIGVIKKGSSEIRESERKNSFEESNPFRETKIYGDQEGDQTYIFGIIDFLTQYDSKKVMEYYFKRVFYGEGISAVPPDDYADRFVDFVQNKVFKVQKLSESIEHKSSINMKSPFFQNKKG